MATKNNKKNWIFILAGVVIIAAALGALFYFKVLTLNFNSNGPVADTGMLASCQQLQQISLNSGNYTVLILGIANGSCHWIYSDATINQTKDCHYPLNYTLNDTFYLSGLLMEKNYSVCPSDACPLEVQMIQNYCR